MIFFLFGLMDGVGFTRFDNESHQVDLYDMVDVARLVGTVLGEGGWNCRSPKK